MRERGKNKGLSAAVFGATGWLFADLLLALAMMFLLADTNGQFVPALPTPTPQPICTPAPQALPALDPNDVDFTIQIDPVGINNNTSTAVKKAQQEVRSNLSNYFARKKLTNSRAGLVILFGGAPTLSDGGAAVTTDQKFYNEVLEGLGNEKPGFVFTGKVALKPLVTFGKPNTVMQVDVFLFTTPMQTAPNSVCVTPTP